MKYSTPLLQELNNELDARFTAIDKAILDTARNSLLLLLEDLPDQQLLYDQYKQFIKEYKFLCQSQKLPTNF